METSFRERAAAGIDVFLVSARTQWLDTRGSPFVILLGVVQPTVFLLITLAPQASPTPARVTQVAIGVLLTSFWASTVWAAAGILRRERLQGTLSRTVSGVRNPLIVVVGKAASASVTSIGTAAVTITVVLVLRRQPVELAAPGWSLLGAIMVVLSGTAIGLLIGTVFLLTRHGPALSSALMYPVFLLGGMLIPIDLVPAWLRWISVFISLRWLQTFLASAASGGPDYAALLIATALTGAYTAAGVLLFRRLVEIGRQKASLDLV